MVSSIAQAIYIKRFHPARDTLKLTVASFRESVINISAWLKKESGGRYEILGGEPGAGIVTRFFVVDLRTADKFGPFNHIEDALNAIGDPGLKRQWALDFREAIGRRSSIHDSTLSGNPHRPF